MADEAIKPAPLFHVHVVTPYELFFDGDAEMVIVTGTDGELGVMAGHTPVVVALSPGEVRLLVDGKWRISATSNGYAEIDRTRMTVVTTSAEWPEDIDVGRAQRALDRASQRVSDKTTAPEEVERSKLGVLRAKARLHVASEHAANSGRAKG
jgi:F-type H+-transporting ATPase subunit epsilon